MNRLCKVAISEFCEEVILVKKKKWKFSHSSFFDKIGFEIMFGDIHVHDTVWKQSSGGHEDIVFTKWP